ncbi:uncharacterized protein LOC122815857 [Protopterus annectens]|uniref:uncharacterized protein LOC122815857 n=1 Tax=Protopterus annectens TaxID=7888 RepID=UPI001CFA89A3|nr:uncharacterized protein LOC122815857 [Protopterus annectens]
MTAAFTFTLGKRVEAPDIHIDEKGNKISCTRKNSNYKYILCILYQNGHQVQDTGKQYNDKHTEKASFTVPDLPDETLFKCLCYTTGERWTRTSSAITKAGKFITEPTTSARITTKRTESTITTTTTTNTSDRNNSTNIIIAVVCVLLLLAALGIIGWLYISKQKKKKVEGVTGASPDGQTQEYAPHAVNSTDGQQAVSTATDKPNTGQDENGLTYALLTFQAASKPRAKDESHTDPSVLYSSIAPKPK